MTTSSRIKCTCGMLTLLLASACGGVEKSSDGSVDPARDVHELDLELVLADHDLVSRRLEKLAQATKRGLNDDEKREQALLAGSVLPWLEQERPLRHLTLDADGDRRLRGFQLLSAKPLLIAANVAEDRVAAPPPPEIAAAAGRDTETIVVSAPIRSPVPGSWRM